MKVFSLRQEVLTAIQSYQDGGEWTDSYGEHGGYDRCGDPYSDVNIG